MVELVFLEIKPPHQGPYGPGLRINGDKGTFNFGQLGDLPG
ncbi:hypothetical protein GALL_515470 [mine drainage metagenome]|uniref:Uncharacterized protein n=1 Tax=mine drainage metagenome TaxID=410659 RepID=A0A1J5P5R7_9ZZZZ